VQFTFHKKTDDIWQTETATDLVAIGETVGKGPFAQRWLQSINLKFSWPDEMWPEIKGKTLERAADYLSGRLKDSDQIWSFSGFNVNERVVMFVIPLLILSLEIYLFANMRILEALLKDGRLKMEPFAWIGVSDDRLSKVLTSLSIIVAPILSIVTLFLRHSDHLIPVNMSVVFAVAIGALSSAGAVFCGAGTVMLLDSISSPGGGCNRTGKAESAA
jgi:hypothetical protein